MMKCFLDVQRKNYWNVSKFKEMCLRIIRVVTKKNTNNALSNPSTRYI